jgi:uncharacterized protein
MIRRTFQHIPGVGPWLEKDLWARGILTWDDFPPAPADENVELKDVVLSRRADPQARQRIALAQSALERNDLAALAELFPPREHWRLYGMFGSRAAFFDIETDGRDTLRPTVVSVFDRTGLRVFLRGRNLEELPAVLAQSDIWVTFNGSVFDVPVLRSHFPEIALPKVHLDLRFLCRKVRLHGGLKQIEDSLGLSRPLHLRGVRGYDAVLLWRAYLKRADLEALRFLVEYNLYDTVNLRGLMDLAYNRAVAALALDVPELPVFERGDILYDVSKLVLALGPSQRDLAVLSRIRQQDRDIRDN